MKSKLVLMTLISAFAATADDHAQIRKDNRDIRNHKHDYHN